MLSQSGQFLTVAIVSLYLFLPSCTPVNNEETGRREISQQERFGEYIMSQSTQSLIQPNEIATKEFLVELDKKLADYMDSIVLFKNWQGSIQDINLEESDRFKTITFNLVFVIQNWKKEMVFHCKYSVLKDSSDQDTIYARIKRMYEYSTVYFDGFIPKDYAGNLQYDSDDPYLRLLRYKFSIMNIDCNKQVDSLSPSLQKAIAVDYQAINLMRKLYSKAINRKAFDSLMTALPIEDCQKALSEKDYQYSKRFRDWIFVDFLLQAPAIEAGPEMKFLGDYQRLEKRYPS